MAKNSNPPPPPVTVIAAASIIRLPFVELPEGQVPAFPRDLTLSLSAARRRKLVAIFQGLQAAGARVMVGRGAVPIELPVSKLADVCYYLLDHAEPAAIEETDTTD